MLKTLFLLALISCFSISSAFADNYFGVAYSIATFDGEEGFPDVSPSSLELKIGTNTSEVVAIEARLSIALASDEVTVSDPFFGDFTIDLDSTHVGLMALLGQDVYAAVGILDVEVEATIDDVSGSASESDLVVGIGFRSSGELGFFGEYLLGTGDLEDTSWLNLGIVKSF